MLSPERHYARAEELLERAAAVRDEVEAARLADPRPLSGELRAWQDRRGERVGRLVEAERLATAAQAHATLAAVPWAPAMVELTGTPDALLDPDEVEALLEVVRALEQWATSETVAPALPRPPAEVWCRATDEAKVTVRSLLDHARGVLAR